MRRRPWKLAEPSIEPGAVRGREPAIPLIELARRHLRQDRIDFLDQVCDSLLRRDIGRPSRFHRSVATRGDASIERATRDLAILLVCRNAVRIHAWDRLEAVPGHAD